MMMMVSFCDEILRHEEDGVAGAKFILLYDPHVNSKLHLIIFTYTSI